MSKMRACPEIGGKVPGSHAGEFLEFPLEMRLISIVQGIQIAGNGICAATLYHLIQRALKPGNPGEHLGGISH